MARLFISGQADAERWALAFSQVRVGNLKREFSVLPGSTCSHQHYRPSGGQAYLLAMRQDVSGVRKRFMLPICKAVFGAGQP